MFWVIRVPAVLLSLALAAAPLGAQGFGKIKRKVSLRRKLPPLVHLTGSFEVKCAARDPQHQQVAQKLGDILETEILQHNNQLLPDKVKPDSVVSCTVISFSLPPAVKVTKTMYNNKGQPVPQQFEEVHGSIVVSYQAKARSGKVLDSDNITERFNGEYDAAGNSTAKTVTEALKKPWRAIKKDKKEAEDAEPKSYEEVLQLLISDAAFDIASHLVKTDESVEVLLARGKLDDQNKLAEAGLWSRMLEPLETMKPLPKTDDDAYRLYNIAVAYEALAYQAEDPKAARKFLDSAAIHYGKAIDANPGEKYFLQPQNRIQTALAHYKKLEGQGAAAAAAPPASREMSPAPAAPAAQAPASASTPSGGPLNNDQVIALAKAGMDEENLIATIKQAPAVSFDFSVDGQLKLVQNGIKGLVLTTMRNRANASAQKKSAPAPKSAAPATPPAAPPKK